jgi:DNA-binding MarR family transcriptional regulator
MQQELINPSEALRKRLVGSLNRQHSPVAVLCAMSVVGLAKQVEESLACHFARYGLTQARFVLLLSIYTAPQKNLRPAELALIMNVKPPTVTGLLSGLARDGLVARRTDKNDRRQAIVSLTRRGRREITKILPDHFQRINEAFARFASPEAKRRLERTIQNVQSSLGALAGRGSGL